MSHSRVTVVGAGLAGSEAAWQLAKAGVRVRLFEMRPAARTAAHVTDRFAELVCSNSFKSEEEASATGLLKAEMERMGSLVLELARAHRVPGGSALAVDRARFSQAVTETLESRPEIEIVRREVLRIPDDRPLVIATGPLTSEALSRSLAELLGAEHLAFYDAVSPILAAESVDAGRGFWASRYGKGDADYLNLPLDRAAYDRLVEGLLASDLYPIHDFEDPDLFHACQPIEDLAHSGRETLRFGCLRPVGLTDPRTGRRPHAVLQLRQENREGTMLSLVGFQTRMRRGEQERIFRAIPGLEKAELLRFGSVHRNTFVSAPTLLGPGNGLRAAPGVFLAGQITGVEGYLESTAMGLLAAVSVRRALAGRPPVDPPAETMLGALTRYLRDTSPERFQPMNVNHGLLPPLAQSLRDKDRRREALRARAAHAIARFAEEEGLAPLRAAAAGETGS